MESKIHLLRTSLLHTLIITSLILTTGFTQTFEEAPEIIEIQFIGNDHLSDDDLYDQIYLKEKVTFISKGSFYNSHHLAREIQKLENYYSLHGFLDAQITDSLSTPVDNTIRIYLNVVEGKQYYLRDVNLAGNRIFSDEKYLELIEFQAGASFNTFKIRENLMEMLSLYKDSGYPLINIQDSVVVDDSVSLYIRVDEGPKLQIGQINIDQYEQISLEVLRREIIVNEGEIFNLTNIEESKRRLYETSLFNSVNIRMGQVDLDAGTINLDVEVIPAKFRGFDMNFGLKQENIVDGDPDLSVRIFGSWYNNNLFDKSRRVRLQTEISSIYPAIFIPQQFKLDFFYVEPWLAKYRIPLTINPFFWYIDDHNSDFKNTAYGLRGIMTYRWFRKIKIQALTEWSKSSSNGDPDELEDLYEEERKVGAKFAWDERDNFFYPHHGFKLVIEPGLVGYFLGGENDYLQLKTSFSTYWTIFANIVLAHNLDIGLAIQKDSDNEVPFEKRFFLGGSSSIRGYEQQALGPVTDGVRIGGNVRYFTNLELRFPIYGLLGGEVFWDIGHLWEDIEDVDISQYQMAVGAGITIDTPIGPARIDYGIPIGDSSVKSTGQLHIAIAYSF